MSTIVNKTVILNPYDTALMGYAKRVSGVWIDRIRYVGGDTLPNRTEVMRVPEFTPLSMIPTIEWADVYEFTTAALRDFYCERPATGKGHMAYVGEAVWFNIITFTVLGIEYHVYEGSEKDRWGMCHRIPMTYGDRKSHPKITMMFKEAIEPAVFNEGYEELRKFYKWDKRYYAQFKRGGE